MKKQFEKLAKLGYDLSDFYSITFTKTAIKLQGEFTPNSYDKYRALGYDFTLEDGMFDATKEGINIVLTEI